MPTSNRSLASTVASLVATTLSLTLTMLMGHRGGVRLPVRNRDIRRVLRSVLTLVQGLLRSSEDAGRSGSESDGESDSHGDDAGDDGDDRRRGHHHHRHTHDDDDHPAVIFTQFRATGGTPLPWHGPLSGRLLHGPSREGPIEIQDDHHPMLAIHDGVQDLGADYPDDPGGSGSAPGSPARVCLHLRQCRRGSNMHMLRVSCRGCGLTLRHEPTRSGVTWKIGACQTREFLCCVWLTICSPISGAEQSHRWLAHHTLTVLGRRATHPPLCMSHLTIWSPSRSRAHKRHRSDCGVECRFVVELVV